MKTSHPCSMWPLVLGSFVVLCHAQAVLGYITVPVPSLGRLTQSTYITVFRVESVTKEKEKGVIVYRKVRDLKGQYPKDVVTHVFSLKDTPQHNGQGDVPIRPDEVDWKYAVEWAKVGKTAVLFNLKYDPFGDFGHTYIDGCWYATMCPKRDWEFWYSIYADPNLLNRWHCGTVDQLIWAVELIMAGKEAVVPVLAGSTKADLRGGKAKVQGLKVSAAILDYDAKRDLVTEALDGTKTPSLVKLLADPNRDVQAKAAVSLGLIGAKADGAAAPLLAMLQDKDAQFRMTAMIALASIGLTADDAKTASPILADAMKDAEPLVRRLAGRELGKLGTPAKGAAPTLAAILPKAEAGERLGIAETMLRIDPENTAANAFLFGQFEDAKTAKESRLAAAEILGLSKAPDVPALTRTMKDPDREIRLATVDLLGRAGPAAKTAVPVLAAAMADDTSGTVRARTATALTKMGTEAKAALPAMKAALNDPRLAGRKEILAEIDAACRAMQ